MRVYQKPVLQILPLITRDIIAVSGSQTAMILGGDAVSENNVDETYASYNEVISFDLDLFRVD